MDPAIKIQKYVYTRILSSFYNAVADLQIIKETDAKLIKISKVPDKVHVETGYAERKWSRNFTVLEGIARIFIKTENFYCPVIFFTVTILKINLFTQEYFFQ